MLDHIKRDIRQSVNNSTPFSDYFMQYVCTIQDMDIDNEILPLIKKESTEVVKFQKRLERSKKRSRRKITIDF